MSSAPIQILGAGLTGMSAAHHLGEGFQIHERLGHAGGHAITIEQDGYRFDRTGHLLHLRDDAMRTWVERLLGGDYLTIQRQSRIWSQGVYTRYPYQANTFGLPAQTAYECLIGYLRARDAEAAAPEPKTFEEFCLKHFGDGFSRHFMIPYNQRLWGVHPRDMTVSWCTRFVPRPKLEDVIAGVVGLNDRELGYNANFIYPRRGIGQLTDALAKELTPSLRLSHAPRAIDWRNKKLLFADGEVPYRALVSTAPLDTLIGLLADAPPAIAAASKKLVCNPLLYLDVALERPCGVDLHWVYVPEERYPFYRVGCYSAFSPEMAPPGKSNLYVELASREAPDLPALRARVTADLIEMQLIERAQDVRFAELRRIDHAYVVYNHDYDESLAVIAPFLAEQGIVSCGRYGGWNYSSMEDALMFGRDAAKRARELSG
jgi:protoporphyrinogen oxidase